MRQKKFTSQDYQENEYTTNSLRARLLIRAYRIAGHLKADLDPLNLTEKKYIPDLDPKTYGLTDAEMEKEVFVDGVFGINQIRLDELIKILENIIVEKLVRSLCIFKIKSKEIGLWIKLKKILNQKKSSQTKEKKQFWKDLQQQRIL